MDRHGYIRFREVEEWDIPTMGKYHLFQLLHIMTKKYMLYLKIGALVSINNLVYNYLSLCMSTDQELEYFLYFKNSD